MIATVRTTLKDVETKADGSFGVTMYDASELDRDGETIDLTNTRAREPVSLQIDHDRSILKTVGRVTNIRTIGQKLRGLLEFAPEGVSAIADQVRRQVESGITRKVSIGFLGSRTRNADNVVVWRDIEVLELSFVSVPSSAGARVDERALNDWLHKQDEEETFLVDLAEVRRICREMVGDHMRGLREPILAGVRAGLLEDYIAKQEQTFHIDMDEIRHLCKQQVLNFVHSAQFRQPIYAAVESALNRVRGRLD